MSKRVIGALVVGFGMTTGAGYLGWRLTSQAPDEPPGSDTTPQAIPVPINRSTGPILAELRRQARAKALPLLDQADAQARAAAVAQVQSLENFFQAARSQLPTLADEVLGWPGHWRLIADHGPFAGSGRHEAFLRAVIDRQLFTAEQLNTKIQDAFKSYLEAESGIEDQLLVRLRQDLTDLDAPIPDLVLDPKTITSTLDQVVADATAQAGAGLRVDAEREFVTLVAGELLARLAVRAVVPLGLSASAPMTFGVGLAAAVVVDQAMTWVWDAASGPREALVKALAARLDGLRHAVIEGTSVTPGLKPRLEGLAKDRAARRRTAILQAIDQAGGAP